MNDKGMLMDVKPGITEFPQESFTHKDDKTISPVIEIGKNKDRVKSLRDEWDNIAYQTGNPLLSFNWFFSCISSFSYKNELNIQILREDGNIKALAPLECRRFFGIRHFEIIGSSELMEPTSFLYNDIHAFEKLFDSILALKTPLILKRLRLQSPLHQIIKHKAKEKSFIVIENRNSSQWMPIESSWEEFLKKLKSSHRSRIRRFCRRLEEKGEVKVEVYSESSENFYTSLCEAFLIEASGWKRKTGTAVLVNEKLKKFFNTYLSASLKEGIVRLFILKVNGTGIAIILGLVFQQSFWILKVGYDEKWSRFAPGIILHHESIKWAFENKLKSYEFLGVSEPWIKTWTDNEHIYYTYRIFPKTINGFLCLIKESILIICKKIYKWKIKI